MDHQRAKLKQQLRRRHHVRRNIVGTSERPRLTVFRSSKHIYAQLIDDLNGVTLASASTVLKEVKDAVKYGGNVKAAQLVGQKLAEAAKQKGITKAAFDRGHYRFHGRVEALARAADAAGLECSREKKPAPPPGADAAPAPKAEKAPKGEKAAKPAKAKKEE